MSKTTTISRNDSVRARSNSSPSAFLLSAKSFVLSKQNHSDDTLFPNFPDDEEEDGNENRWFDCLHLDCLGNRPHLAGRTSTTTAVIDFLVVIMIATLGVYFLLNDFLIGGLGKSNGRFVSFCDSFRTCFVFRQIENRKRNRTASTSSPGAQSPDPRSPHSSPSTLPPSPHSPSSENEFEFDGGDVQATWLSTVTASLARLFRALRIKYSVGTFTSLLLSKWPVWMHNTRHVGSFLISYISINSQFNLIFNTLARSLLLQLVLNTTAALYKFRKIHFAAYTTAEISKNFWLSQLIMLMVGEGVSFGFVYDKYSRRYRGMKAWKRSAYHMLNWRVGCTVLASIILYFSHRSALSTDAKHICNCIAFILLWTRYCAKTTQSIVKNKVIDPLKNLRQWMCECREKTSTKPNPNPNPNPTTPAKAETETEQKQSPIHLKQD